MRTYLTSRMSWIFLAAGLWITAGCTTTQPSSYYTLSALQPTNTESAATGSGGSSVGLGPVNLPEYLDRPQIVTRTSPNQLKLAEFQRWAEPLEQIFSRVVAENLSAMLRSERIVLLPRRRGGPTDFQIEIDVTQFDTDTEGKTVLAARWSLYGRDSDEPLATRTSILTRQVADFSSFEPMIAVMSQTVEALCRDIAQALDLIIRRTAQSNRWIEN